MKSSQKTKVINFQKRKKRDFLDSKRWLGTFTVSFGLILLVLFFFLTAGPGAWGVAIPGPRHADPPPPEDSMRKTAVPLGR